MIHSTTLRLLYHQTLLSFLSGTDLLQESFLSGTDFLQDSVFTREFVFFCPGQASGVMWLWSMTSESLNCVIGSRSKDYWVKVKGLLIFVIQHIDLGLWLCAGNSSFFYKLPCLKTVQTV